MTLTKPVRKLAIKSSDILKKTMLSVEVGPFFSVFLPLRLKRKGTCKNGVLHLTLPVTTEGPTSPLN